MSRSTLCVRVHSAQVIDHHSLLHASWWIMCVRSSPVDAESSCMDALPHCQSVLSSCMQRHDLGMAGRLCQQPYDPDTPTHCCLAPSGSGSASELDAAADTRRCCCTAGCLAGCTRSSHALLRATRRPAVGAWQWGRLLPLQGRTTLGRHGSAVGLFTCSEVPCDAIFNMLCLDNSRASSLSSI